MSETRHILRADRLEFTYRPNVPVLQQVSLRAEAGKFLCILGPNGSGKTTLLRCLLGKLTPQAGQVVLDDQPIARYSSVGLARLMAYVPQIPASAFAFTVQEIVLVGRLAHTGMLGLAGEEDLTVARLAMKMTNTLQFADRTLEELSGGEAQRVMIARALAQQPQVALLDEPTSHLDIKNQLTIYQMMERLAHDWGMAVVCVSHDVNLAARFADELVLMRDGKVLADGRPQETIREEILSEVYQVEIDLIPLPGSSVPLVHVR